MPSTINVRLAAVRRLAYEAADTGLLSPELAAGIRRVKGAKRLNVRIGNWLALEQAKGLLRSSDTGTIRAKRDWAILALLIGCGLRRAELVGLKKKDFQMREEHWIVADLVGKGKHIRTVPVPLWTKRVVEEWIAAAEIDDGSVFRRVNHFGRIWGSGITPNVELMPCIECARAIIQAGITEVIVSADRMSRYVSDKYSEQHAIAELMADRSPGVGASGPITHVLSVARTSGARTIEGFATGR